MEDQYYKIGHNIFGPFLKAYTHWLLTEIKKLAPRKVFFLSRDGYLMLEAVRLVENNQPPYEYVHFSRRSIRNCLLWTRRNLNDMVSLLAWKRYVSVAEVLSFLSQGDEKLMKAANAISESNRFIKFEDIANNEQIKDFVSSNYRNIYDASASNFDLIIKYLRQIDFSGNVAIVDIGWHGTMQAQLEELLKVSNINAKITGLYVGINTSHDISTDSYKGFLFSNDNPRKKNRVLCSLGLIEKLFQKEEGSTIGYDIKNSKIEPVLDLFEYKSDPEISQHINSLQNGALSFIKESDTREGITESETDRLIQFGMKPRLNSLNLFKNFYNIDNGEKIYFLPQKSIFHYSFGELKKRLSDSPWKTGFLKELIKLPLPYYWLYSLIKK